jgi:hypothetical protein
MERRMEVLVATPWVGRPRVRQVAKHRLRRRGRILVMLSARVPRRDVRAACGEGAEPLAFAGRGSTLRNIFVDKLSDGHYHLPV